MGFNKRYITKKNLDIVKKDGLDYLIRYITNPDCLIIEDEYSSKVCEIVGKTKSKTDIKKKLIEIGFYES